MIRLRSRTQSPVNGFQFRQPQMAWFNLNADPSSQWDFNRLVDLVQALRRSNPRFNLPTDRAAIEAEVDYANALRMKGIRGAESYWYEDQGATPPFPLPSPSLPQPAGAKGVVAGIGKYLGNTVAGMKLYLHWTGQGGEFVSPELAEKRAAVCCSPCPKMVVGNFAQRWNAAAAGEIMAILGILKDLKHATSFDNQLAICDPCDCPLKAKVWSPIDVILKDIRPEAKANLWDRCWITHEEKGEPKLVMT